MQCCTHMRRSCPSGDGLCNFGQSAETERACCQSDCVASLLYIEVHGLHRKSSMTSPIWACLLPPLASSSAVFRVLYQRPYTVTSTRTYRFR